MRTNLSSALIVGLPLPSVLRNKSSSNLKVILTSLSAVPPAAKQGRQSVTEMVALATDPNAKCSRQYAPSVAKRPKYRSSLVKVDQYIVVTATVRSDQTDNFSFDLEDIPRLGILSLGMSL